MSSRSYENFPEVKSAELQAIFGKIGNTLQVAGIVFQGELTNYMLILPGYELGLITRSFQPTSAEWTAILHQSDNPIVFQMDKTGVLKPFIRKMQYAISGDVQQKIWVADGYKCMYCGRKMGEVTLSIDHFMPLELGGANDPSNFLSSCRKCNKRKGNMHPVEWCDTIHRRYQDFMDYLAERKL